MTEVPINRNIMTYKEAEEFRRQMEAERLGQQAEAEYSQPCEEGGLDHGDYLNDGKRIEIDYRKSSLVTPAILNMPAVSVYKR